MSEINAAFGLANLNLLLEERRQRQAVLSIYMDVLENCKLVQVVPRRRDSVNPNQYFAIRLVGSEKTRLRDYVYETLRAKGIYARRYFYPLLSDVPAIRARLSQTAFNFPNAARAAAEILVLPLHGGIDQEDAAMIAKAVREAAYA
jgi:dTDP-4-amino-4,6-dideoxygalactose transaminase